MTFSLPRGWTKFNLSEEITAYYNYEQKVFSLSPAMDVPSFLTIAVS
jgi:hypothetical protein